MQHFAVELNAIQENFMLALETLAGRVRRDVVIHACRKHHLGFISGMGMFFFFRLKGRTSEQTYGERKDLEAPLPDGFRGLSKAAKGTLGPILDLLNTDVCLGGPLGYWVTDVREEDFVSVERKKKR